MKYPSNTNDIPSLILFKNKVLKHYQTILEKHQKKVLSSGFNQYREETWVHTYPVGGFLEIPGRLILFEVNTSAPFNDDDIQSIFTFQFRPLSNRKKIVGIIENPLGFHEIKSDALSFEDYPVILTKNNELIYSNQNAQRDTLTKRCLFPKCEVITESVKTNVVQPVNNDKDYNMLAFILDGSVRMKTYVRLLKGPSYAYQIATEEKLLLTSVTRSLQDLLKEAVIECITPKKRRRKFYRLTPSALKLQEDVLKHLESLD